MELVQVNQNKDIEQKCSIIKVKVGDATITLKDQLGMLMVYGDDSDLMIQPNTANSFYIVTTPAFAEQSESGA